MWFQNSSNVLHEDWERRARRHYGAGVCHWSDSAFINSWNAPIDCPLPLFSDKAVFLFEAQQEFGCQSCINLVQLALLPNSLQQQTLEGTNSWTQVNRPVSTTRKWVACSYRHTLFHCAVFLHIAFYKLKVSDNTVWSDAMFLAVCAHYFFIFL